MRKRLNVVDSRQPCPHCGDLANEEPDGTKHCNTIGCAGFRTDLWPAGSIGRNALRETDHADD